MTHIIQPDPIKSAMAAQQLEAARRQAIDSFVKATAIGVYSHLVSIALEYDAVAYRDLAKQAVAAAPYLAEAFGMGTVEKELMSDGQVAGNG